MKFHDIHEECGVFGVYGHSEASNLAYLGLYALQHRGQEGAGICSSDGRHLHLDKSMGLVADIFSEKRLKKLTGHIAIGHNRYSTAGSSVLKNVQPILANFALGPLAIAHNGNLVNAGEIREELEKEGAIFQSTSDSEVIVHLIAHSKTGDFYERVGRLNNEEYRLAKAIDDLPNIRWWFRNSDRDGFYIQGYLPHSFNPDFILETKTGCIIAVEYKGEHLADREYKEKIGNIWGSINEKYKFVMATKSDIEDKVNTIAKL